MGRSHFEIHWHRETERITMKIVKNTCGGKNAHISADELDTIIKTYVKSKGYKPGKYPCFSFDSRPREQYDETIVTGVSIELEN
jgi:hypothetical protein